MIYERIEISGSIFTKVINGVNFVCGSYDFGRALEDGDSIKALSISEDTHWHIQNCICSIYTDETRTEYLYEKIDGVLNLKDRIVNSNLHANAITIFGTNNQSIYGGTSPGLNLPYSFPFVIINTFDKKPVILSNSISMSTTNISDGKVTILSYRFGDSSKYTCFSATASNIGKSQSSSRTILGVKWYDFYSNSTVKDPDTDPYSGGGNSGGGGGTGNFDDTSDTIGIPSLPTVSGLNTGFFTAFVCTQSQLQAVSAYLWNNVIDDILDVDTGFSKKIDALKKVVANPYDAIMGCSLVPVSPPTGGSKEMKMYGIVKTGISLPYASSRWVSVDCGTLNIHEFWGSYLDYSPYTKTTSLYLPYIGVVPVDIDLIMAKALQIVYHVDILSGICIAYIIVDGSVKFQYQGHCSTTIPITSSDYSGSIQAGLGLVGNVSNIVTGGISGGVSGGPVGAAVGAVGSAISQAPSIASNVMGMKPDIKSGGSVGSSGGILGVQKPYLIIERPRQSVPERQNHFTGYPSNMHATIGSLSGYTEFERVNIDGITLTDEEKAELENILKGGVYL